MQVLPKAIYGFITLSIKIPMIFFFFCKDRTTYPKIHREFQGNLNSQNSWEKGTKPEGLRVPDFKTYKKSAIIKTV